MRLIALLALTALAPGAHALALHARSPASCIARSPRAGRTCPRAAVADRSGDSEDSPEALLRQWQDQLKAELGDAEINRLEREERALSIWKRLVARDERRLWRQRKAELAKAARVEVAATRRREVDFASESVEWDGGTDIGDDDTDDAAVSLAWEARSAASAGSAAKAARARAEGPSGKEEVVETVGIDLGTTNSLVACFQEGKPAVLEVGGELMTPSAVAYVRVDEKATSSGKKKQARGKARMGPAILAPVKADSVSAALNAGSGRNEGTGVLVGTQAQLRAQDDPSSTFRSVKRILGRRDVGQEEVAKMRWLAPVRVQGAGATGEVLFACDGVDVPFSAVDVSAEVVRALLDGACSSLRTPVRSAVVTVPAHFSEAQRAATETACVLAGLDQVHLLREPEAAALAYGFNAPQDERCLVFDLGGGTFDVSVVDVGGDTIEIISTTGDVQLGGDDFDEAIAAFLTQEVVKSGDMLPDTSARHRLVSAAREARHNLTTSTSTEIHLTHLTGTRAGEEVQADLSLTLTRRKMEALTKHLIERMVPPLVKAARDAGIRLAVATEDEEAEEALDALSREADDPSAVAARATPVGGRQTKARRARANVAWRWQRMVRRWAAGNHKLQRFAPGVPISRVILVGGATRMPCVRRLIKRVMGIDAVLTVDPETAVAEGAAVQAAILDGLPSAGRLAVFNPHHGGRLHRRRSASGTLAEAAAAASEMK